ncbi:MAG: class I SAM-dependent rRNA methyltransferase [Bacteroidetes bacterium]|nr:class I SAM-dependent rRNA methyltransferase [Bacteroidota bacterium]
MKKVPARREGLVKVVLKSGKDQSVMRYHPWLFSGAIKKVYGDPAEGDLVEIFDNKETLLGTGHYSPGSIAIRILSFGKNPVDDGFFAGMVRKAVEYRRNLGFNPSSGTSMFRLIHGEGDGLPGLIADYYNGTVVTQFHSAGMYRSRNTIADAIVENGLFPVHSVYDKSMATLPGAASPVNENAFLRGISDNPVEIEENNLRFRIDIIGGQKTGFFIDQRDNRKLASNFSAGKTLLNLFSYTGGFSVYAMKNAALVHSVDSSAPASALARENIILNYGNTPNHEAIEADAFEYLGGTQGRYDMMILDPPAFAKHNSVLGNALQGYKRLNMKAIEAIRPGGIIFTFSCSQVVSRENFRKSVFAAAANTGRRVRILHQMGQPADHPVNIYHPESEYLKGLVLHVE